MAAILFKERLVKQQFVDMLCQRHTCMILSPRPHGPTVANSCTVQCEWHRLRMEAIFSIKIWGSYRVYLYAEPERFDTMIICESMRIRHELNTNWYDAVRCNKMQHDGDTMQYEAVRWWWRINTIALWCDENTIGTKQRVLMHRHQGWNVRHGLCHIYMIYIYIYELFIAFVCFVVCSLL